MENIDFYKFKADLLRKAKNSGELVTLNMRSGKVLGPAKVKQEEDGIITLSSNDGQTYCSVENIESIGDGKL